MASGWLLVAKIRARLTRLVLRQVGGAGSQVEIDLPANNLARATRSGVPRDWSAMIWIMAWATSVSLPGLIGSHRSDLAPVSDMRGSSGHQVTALAIGLAAEIAVLDAITHLREAGAQQVGIEGNHHVGIATGYRPADRLCQTGPCRVCARVAVPFMTGKQVVNDRGSARQGRR